MRERSHGSSELEDMRRGRAGCWCGRLVTDLGEFSVRESSIDLEFPHPELSNCHRPFSLFPFFVYLALCLCLSLSLSFSLSLLPFSLSLSLGLFVFRCTYVVHAFCGSVATRIPTVPVAASTTVSQETPLSRQTFEVLLKTPGGFAAVR